MNINTPEFWSERFSGGEWVRLGGCEQTVCFARAQARIIPISKSFAGTIVDFGCATGDSIPVFHRAWPMARIIGVDFAQPAIDVALSNHGHLARFVTGSHQECPDADFIIASNVLEHLDDDIAVTQCLLEKCRELFVIVPFEEQFMISEHLRRYDKRSFSQFNVLSIKTFPCRKWSHYGLRDRWWQVHCKNIIRPFFKKPRINRRLQVMYRIKGAL